MDKAVEYIKNGVRKAYFDYINFQSPNSNFPSSITEYLFTVSVARELQNLKKDLPMEDCCIFLEYPAKDFINNAFRRYIYEKKPGDLTAETIIKRRKNHRIGRKGRIDIVVLSKIIGKQLSEPQSNIGVELKGINPNLKKVEKDLQRLKKAMTAIDDIGKNYISLCVCAFVKRLDSNKSIYDVKNKQKQLNRYEDKLNKLLSKIFKRSNIVPDIEFFEIDSTSRDDYERNYPEEVRNDADAIAETGALTGIIITLKNS